MNKDPIHPLETRAGCVGSAMRVIGKKWTALILCDLTSGPKRFRDFEVSIPTINPRTLAARLEDLSTLGVITKCGSSGYRLTKKGEALIPVLRAMADWGDTYS